ncbi:hypothetical protein Y697_05650 [Mesotoga sp. BH458_6_3_2_1]|nr:hypothetical protein Y697_05650 [Mesotoga sp. BH458_6_3_2_1]
MIRESKNSDKIEVPILLYRPRTALNTSFVILETRYKEGPFRGRRRKVLPLEASGVTSMQPGAFLHFLRAFKKTVLQLLLRLILFRGFVHDTAHMTRAAAKVETSVLEFYLQTQCYSVQSCATLFKQLSFFSFLFNVFFSIQRINPPFQTSTCLYL